MWPKSVTYVTGVDWSADWQWLTDDQAQELLNAVRDTLQDRGDAAVTSHCPDVVCDVRKPSTCEWISQQDKPLVDPWLCAILGITPRKRRSIPANPFGYLQSNS
jgi:hypothetical protein